MEGSIFKIDATQLVKEILSMKDEFDEFELSMGNWGETWVKMKWKRQLKKE